MVDVWRPIVKRDVWRPIVERGREI